MTLRKGDKVKFRWPKRSNESPVTRRGTVLSFGDDGRVHVAVRGSFTTVFVKPEDVWVSHPSAIIKTTTNDTENGS